MYIVYCIYKLNLNRIESNRPIGTGFYFSAGTFMHIYICWAHHWTVVYIIIIIIIIINRQHFEEKQKKQHSKITITCVFGHRKHTHTINTSLSHAHIQPLTHDLGYFVVIIVLLYLVENIRWIGIVFPKIADLVHSVSNSGFCVHN